ncbi:hypothetical protein EBV26_16680 [bacterium]|nr:hypothetical protein [bacterium]
MIQTQSQNEEIRQIDNKVLHKVSNKFSWTARDFVWQMLSRKVWDKVWLKARGKVWWSFKHEVRSEVWRKLFK